MMIASSSDLKLPASPGVRVILNPRAGWRFGNRCEKAMERLASSGWRCDLMRPASVEETVALGVNPGGYDLTVISGGDGTISAFLQNAPLEKTVIGLFPSGTANVVARDIGMPLRPELAAEVMLRRRLCEMDVGEARWPDGSRRRFILSCSTGSIAQAVVDVSPRLKMFSGQGAYAASFLKSIVAPHRVTVKIEHEEFESSLAVALLTRHYAGGFVPAPDAVQGDGKFDLFVLDGRLFSYAGFLLARMNKFWPFTRFVRHRTVARISILTPGPLEMDGDPVQDSPVELSIAGKVRMLCV